MWHHQILKIHPRLDDTFHWCIYRFSYFPTDIGDISSGSHDPKLLSYHGSLVMIEMKHFPKNTVQPKSNLIIFDHNHNMQSLDKTKESLGDTLVSSGPSKTMMRHDSLPPLHSEFRTFVWLSWLQNEGHRRCDSLDQKANRRILPSAGYDKWLCQTLVQYWFKKTMIHVGQRFPWKYMSMSTFKLLTILAQNWVYRGMFVNPTLTLL